MSSWKEQPLTICMLPKNEFVWIWCAIHNFHMNGISKFCSTMFHCCQRIVWVCLAILWGWRIKGWFVCWKSCYDSFTPPSNSRTLNKRKCLLTLFVSVVRSTELIYQLLNLFEAFIWDKVFENGPSKICGRQPLNKIYLVHSWILEPIFLPTLGKELNAWFSNVSFLSIVIWRSFTGSKLKHYLKQKQHFY